jgi:dGTPase
MAGYISEWDERRSGTHADRPDDIRTPAERDYSRLVHSAAFRRLQGKTQVLGVGEDDFYRTRLTHSLEASQIGVAILRAIHRHQQEDPDVLENLPDETRLYTATLAHDLGHPPFGHGGEIALSYAMSDYGGFEANAQTLRIICKLARQTQTFGLDFTRRTLLATLKYPASFSCLKAHETAETEKDRDKTTHFVSRDWKPPKCYYDEEDTVVEWALEPLRTQDKEFLTQISSPARHSHGKCLRYTLDTSIMDVADEIAYATHDLEDAIHLGMIKRNDWDEVVRWRICNIDKSWRRQFSLSDVDGFSSALFSESQHIRKQAFGTLVNAVIGSTTFVKFDGATHPFVKYNVVLSEPARALINTLRDFVRELVIFDPQVQTLEYKGQQFVISLFNAYQSDPGRLLPRSTIARMEENDTEPERVVCDHISGMTDEFATQMYERLHAPRRGSVFRIV